MSFSEALLLLAPCSLLFDHFVRSRQHIRDGNLILWESHAILAYLGEKTEKMWPTSMQGKADALRWLFFLSGHISPPAVDLVYNRIAAKMLGARANEDAIPRGEKTLPAVIRILKGQLANGKWLLGDDFTLIECAYGPALHVLEKASFSFEEFPKVRADMDMIRSRPAWLKTPKLPGL